MSSSEDKRNTDPQVTPEGLAFSQIKTILDGLSGKARLETIKSLGGLYGHRVLPGTGLGPQSGPASKVRVGEKFPKGPSQPKSSKTPEEKMIAKQISKLNEEIKLKSKAKGTTLAEDDPLIIKRGRLFREKHEKQVNQNASQSGASG